MENNTLVLAIGNPARGDDGIGPSFIEAFEKAKPLGTETSVDYQLCVEDAVDVCNYNQVIFVDASRNGAEPFDYYPVNDSSTVNSFDTHAFSPDSVMTMAKVLFGSMTPAFVLSIRGYKFEAFTEYLSRKAENNVREAVIFLVDRLTHDHSGN